MRLSVFWTQVIRISLFFYSHFYLTLSCEKRELCAHTQKRKSKQTKLSFINSNNAAGEKNIEKRRYQIGNQNKIEKLPATCALCSFLSHSATVCRINWNPPTESELQSHYQIAVTPHWRQVAQKRQVSASQKVCK